MNKKICMIAPANLKYVPYWKYFVDELDEHNVSCDIISWNKANIEEDVEYSFNYIVDDFDRKRMLLGYLQFGKFCKKIICKEKYDKIICLTIAPAFFCGLNMWRKYSGRFILDIRDESPLTCVFPWPFAKICNWSFAITTSSMMFSKWIPKETIICHNIDTNVLIQHYSDEIVRHCSKVKSIVFAGMMIEENANIQFINKLHDVDNVRLSFIGRETEGTRVLKKYIRDNGISNVFFEGTYDKDEIIDIYRDKADFVNIIRSDTSINRNAIPNKFYDAVVSGVPVIVYDHNVGIAQYVLHYNLGIVLKEEDICNLTEKMNSFNFDLYRKGRKAFLDKVLSEAEMFKSLVRDFLDK